MHLVFRESHGLEEQAVPQDLGQRPGDVVVLSFSDSDLSAFAAGWRAGGFPWSLRLANLAALVHPLSVDTYVEQTLVHAKAILIRLIGGAAYWEYGLREVERLAAERGIALVVLAADGREDRRLMAASTVDEAMVRRLGALCDAGGADAVAMALGEIVALPSVALAPPQPLPLPGEGLCLACEPAPNAPRYGAATKGKHHAATHHPARPFRDRGRGGRAHPGRHLFSRRCGRYFGPARL